MKIEIEYNGAIAKCLVNGKPIHTCSTTEQNMMLSAFATIKKHIIREKENIKKIIKNYKLLPMHILVMILKPRMLVVKSHINNF